MKLVWDFVTNFVSPTSMFPWLTKTSRFMNFCRFHISHQTMRICLEALTGLFETIPKKDFRFISRWPTWNYFISVINSLLESWIIELSTLRILRELVNLCRRCRRSILESFSKLLIVLRIDISRFIDVGDRISILVTSFECCSSFCLQHPSLTSI